MSTPSGHGGENVPPPSISNYFSEIFSSFMIHESWNDIPYNMAHVKLTYNNPISNKDFKSVKRPWEVEKFK